MNSSPRQWYTEWARAQGTPFSRKDSWSKELSSSTLPLNMDWNSIFLVPFKTTRETKLQSFAYRLTYRLSPCNSYLAKIAIKETDTCAFCDGTDSISHFFLRCPVVKPFWDQLTKWSSDYLDLSLDDLTEAQLLLGVLHRARDGKVLNWLILFVFYTETKVIFPRGHPLHSLPQRGQGQNLHGKASLHVAK